MIVGLIGYKTSGKSTVAALMSAYGWHVVPFAEPLKRMLSSLTGRKRYPHKNYEVPELGDRTLRHALQTLGTEWGRDHIHAELWLQHWQRSVAELRNEDGNLPNIVVDDVRFTNEVQLIREMGGKIYMVDRGLESNDKHRSESATALYRDGTIYNTGSVLDLHRKLVMHGII